MRGDERRGADGSRLETGAAGGGACLPSSLPWHARSPMRHAPRGYEQHAEWEQPSMPCKAGAALQRARGCGTAPPWRGCARRAAGAWCVLRRRARAAGGRERRGAGAGYAGGGGCGGGVGPGARGRARRRTRERTARRQGASKPGRGGFAHPKWRMSRWSRSGARRRRLPSARRRLDGRRGRASGASGRARWRQSADCVRGFQY